MMFPKANKGEVLGEIFFSILKQLDPLDLSIGL